MTVVTLAVTLSIDYFFVMAICSVGFNAYLVFV